MAEAKPDPGDFLGLVFGMIEAGLAGAPDARPMVDKAARRLAVHPINFTPQLAGRLPVCGHLGNALRAARAHGAEAAMVADAFAALEPRLGWGLRARAAAQGDGFLHGHANALLVGHADYAKAEAVTLGVSLLAPGVTYPEHAHPPEELYVVLSPGRWRQEQGPWQDRKAGELVHNPPAINHAMQSGSTPLLALWLLWNE